MALGAAEGNRRHRPIGYRHPSMTMVLPTRASRANSVASRRMVAAGTVVISSAYSGVNFFRCP